MCFQYVSFGPDGYTVFFLNLPAVALFSSSSEQQPEERKVHAHTCTRTYTASHLASCFLLPLSALFTWGCSDCPQVRKYKSMILEDLESALLEHAPAPQEVNSELPPLTIDGIPVSVDKMTQVGKQKPWTSGGTSKE